MKNLCGCFQKKLQYKFIKINELYKYYRSQIQRINKTIRPFSAADEWNTAGEIEKQLLHCFTVIN